LQKLDEFDFFWTCAININTGQTCIKAPLY
jgi:hypothetical protein